MWLHGHQVFRYLVYLDEEVDEPSSDASPHNVHEEVANGKQPGVWVLQALLSQRLHDAGLGLIPSCTHACHFKTCMADAHSTQVRMSQITYMHWRCPSSCMQFHSRTSRIQVASILVCTDGREDCHADPHAHKALIANPVRG